MCKNFWNGLTVICCLGLLICPNLTSAQSKQSKQAVKPAVCSQFKIEDKASQALQTVKLPPQAGSCKASMKNGFLIPDPQCTPGAINPTLTSEVLRNPKFTTRCVRNDTTTEEEKAQTYGWYGIKHPANNSGSTQTCELDHLISLELGGADTLDNIWPQCGPAKVALAKRYFKQKDMVENYLAKQIKEGKMPLAEVQKGIATNWPQYLDEARKVCPGGKCKK